MADRRNSTEVLVVGLGRFGSTAAIELERLGHEVLAVDQSDEVVQSFASEVTHVVCADATDEQVLMSLGVGSIEHALVAIGDDVEASILCTSALADLGVNEIRARATSKAHARILDRVGATHVVFPESDMAVRIAHRVAGRMIDYIEIDENFALVETFAPKDTEGRTLQEAQLRARFGITVVSIKPENGSFSYATPDSVLAPGSLLLVAGDKNAVERFAQTA